MDLVKILEDHFPEEELKKPRVDQLSPSRITKCPRGAFMDSLGYGEPIDFSSRINLSFGTMRHESIEKLLKSKNVIEEREYYASMDDPPIHGYIDGILNTNPKKILEIKTTGKSLSQLNAPLEDHIDQATLYMYMTGIKNTIFLYETKDDKSKKSGNPWKQIEIEYDEQRAKKLLAKARYLMKCLENRTLPFPSSDCFNCKNPYCHDIKLHRKENLI